MEDTLSAPGIITIFAGVLIVAGLAYWIYSAIYRKRLERALKEDAPAATPAPEPRLAGKLILWLAVAVCAVGLLLRAASLQSRLENLELSMRNDMSNLSTNLSNQIYSNYQELIEELRKENSLFLLSDYATVGTDFARQTVLVRFTAVPKAAKEGAEVSLRFGGRSFPLSRQADGSYSAEIELGFSELPQEDSALLCLTEDGVERNEEVEFWPQDWREDFPQVEVNHGGGAITGTDGPQHLDLTVFVYLFNNKSEIRELTLRALDSSGELLREKDLMPELNQDDFTVEAYDVCTDFSGDYSVGQEVRFLLRCENNAGLAREILFASLSPDGSLLEEGTERFFSPDGALLWETVPDRQ